jgi:xanthine dehydrogenase accessory factor
MEKFFLTLSEMIRNHSSLALATVIRTSGSTPREVGAKMIILHDGTTYGTLGGGKLELLATQDAIEAIQIGESKTKEYSLIEENKGGIGVPCGGKAMVFIDVIHRHEHLMILGGGHIGLALYKMALELGFSVTVVDTRAEFVTTERFPKAELLLNCNVDNPQVMDAIDKNTYIVVVTHEHTQDKLAVKRFIATDCKYLGMIGSKRKVKEIKTELKNVGISNELLDKVYAPIGLGIKAETPEEIAVSILAEIINVRHSGQPSEISLKLPKEGLDAGK